jgi:hypothetical protein
MSFTKGIGTGTHYGVDSPAIESQWGENFSTPFRRFLGLLSLL